MPGRPFRERVSFALTALVAVGIAATPGASPLHAQVAVPYYSPGAFVVALQMRAQAPFASQFAESAGHLVESVAALCEAAATRGARKPAASEQTGEDADPPDPSEEALLGAQQSWLAAADAWERLQAISLGATLERRSARRIDTRPSRPRSIRAAISPPGGGRAPPGAKAVARGAAPAKGLPALEWLLWDQAVPTHAAGCRYAIGLAQDVRREAEALAEAHAELATRWLGGESKAGDEARPIEAHAAEAINQWMAGLEALRWQQLGKPLATITRGSGEGGRAVAVAGAVAPDPHDDAWPRPPSASHRDAWRARWEALRQLAIGPAPTDGFGPQPVVAPTVISLEALLRGRGRNEDADRWARAVMAADQAMQALTETPAGSSGGACAAGAQGASGSASRGAAAAPDAVGGPVPATSPEGGTPLPPIAAMEQAVQALDAVKQFLQATVAPALSVKLAIPGPESDERSRSPPRSGGTITVSRPESLRPGLPRLTVLTVASAGDAAASPSSRRARPPR